jgi:hypothetical protein
MEARQSIVTFIVRVTESDGTGLGGTVQRVKTGERHRFRGTSELARILERAVDVEQRASPDEGTGP